MRLSGQGHLVPPALPPAPTPSVSTPSPPNGALPFLTRDLLAPGPPQRLAVRQGPAGQGGVQVAGLTHWDVPSLESLHQVRLPSGAPQLSQPLPLPASGGAGPAIGQPLSAHPADAEPGEEQPGHRRHSHEPAQLSLARPGHADTAHSVPIARYRHRRYLGA